MTVAEASDCILQRSDTLLRLWSDLAMRHVALGGACGCGMGGISLRLEDFELDIFDYLQDAGLRSGEPAVAAFFEAWGPAASRPEPVRLLLQRLGGGAVEPGGAEWILARLERSLRSFASLHGSQAEA
ncbi:hypothetical protein C8246_21035 [Paracidovorax avenae]|nr:hypothetical protein C8246_21035 [Paracidovorax avenae]